MSITIWDLISWGLWVAFYGGVACFIAAVVAKMMGKEYAGRLFFSALAAIAVSMFGWSIVTAVAPPTSTQWDWIYLALAGGLIAVSSIYFAIGRVEEGGKYILFALLVVGAMAFALGLGRGISAGQLTVRAEFQKQEGADWVPTSTLVSGEWYAFCVGLEPRANMDYIYVDWGDGTGPGYCFDCGDYRCFSKKYDLASDQAAKAFQVKVTVLSGNRKGQNTLSVIVQNPGWCPYNWPFNFVCGLTRMASVVLPGLDLVKLVTNPEFPVRDGDPVYDIYKNVLGISMTALGLYLALGLAFGAFEGRVVEVFKDAVLALALALLIPWIYNASIGVLNQISLVVIGDTWIDPVLPSMALVAMGLAIGYFVPALAQIASALVIVLLTLSAVVLMRYVLILALVAAFPLIAVASINPLFRGIMRHCLTLLAGLAIAGPITAVFLVVLSKIAPGGGIAISFLYPIVGGILPNLLSIFGAGVAAGLGGAIAERVRSLAGRAGTAMQRQQQQQQARAGQTTRVPTPAMSTAKVAQSSAGAGQTPAARPAPIVGWSKLKTAWREGGLRRQATEGVAEAQRLPTREFFAMAEAEEKGMPREQALAKVAEERAHEPAVSPRAEQLKTFARSLASQSWQQLKTNARAFTRELKYAIARDFGVKTVPKKAEHAATAGEPVREARRPIQS